MEKESDVPSIIEINYENTADNPLRKYFVKHGKSRKVSLELQKEVSGDTYISNPITLTNLPLNVNNQSTLGKVFDQQGTLTNISNDDFLQQSPLLVERRIANHLTMNLQRMESTT